MDISKYLTLTENDFISIGMQVENYLTGRDKSEIEDMEMYIMKDGKETHAIYIEFYIQLESIGLKTVEIQELKYDNILRRDSTVLSWIIQDEVLDDWNEEYKRMVESWTHHYA